MKGPKALMRKETSPPLWSEQRESNPHTQLGRLLYYRYTMLAHSCGHPELDRDNVAE